MLATDLVEQDGDPMKALDGIRVLDLSRLLPGPFATQLLADLGAEVIKVEAPQGGDYLRHYPPLVADGNSALFHAVNRGKKSVALDLKSDAGKAALQALLPTADVVIESFRPGVMAKLGFGPDVLRELHPRLVVCAISGYGQATALALKAGHDLNYMARSGVLGMQRGPRVAPVPVADYAGGAWPAVTQVLAALLLRDKTGEGAFIDVDMTRNVSALLTLPRAEAAAGVRVDVGDDLLVGSIPAYQVYATQDGHLAVGALEPHFWMRFCQAVVDACPDLADADLLSVGLSKGDDGQRAQARVQEALASKSTSEWVALLDAVDACVEPVLHDGDDGLHQSPTVPVSVGDDVLPLPGPPLDVTPETAPGPALGADTEALLRDAGVDDNVVQAVLDVLH